MDLVNSNLNMQFLCNNGYICGFNIVFNRLIGLLCTVIPVYPFEHISLIYMDKTIALKDYKI